MQSMMKQSVLLLAVVWASGPGCTADEECYQTLNWRCVDSGLVGSSCVLDRAYNLTGHCSCGVEQCVNLTVAAPSPGKKQYLVIGDSISNGYFGILRKTLESDGTWEVFHAPGNNDNANWGRRCLSDWLGADPKRWDVISMNWGLHDLAFPDNEHLSVGTYAILLSDIRNQLKLLTRSDTTLLWVSTTPVPINPPPNPDTGKSCELLPGRVESDVLRYNAAASKVMEDLQTCDLHKVITDHCGVGFSTCDIAQCGGPHFEGSGFPMLGSAMADCVAAASIHSSSSALV